jgi:serine/threonine protein phosphatase PrpC
VYLGPWQKMRVEAAALSDVGRLRSVNEDAYGLLPQANFFVVCDGMGGAAAGEVASQTAVVAALEETESRKEKGPDELLKAIVATANQRIFAHSLQDPSLHGMGTTLVALLVCDEQVWIAHVGDSRCYRFRAGHLERLTQDHSLVGEQVRIGQLTAAEAERSPLRHVITRAVGTQERVVADIARFSVQPEDLFLLCSDGLTKEVSEPKIAEVLLQEGDLRFLCQRLIDEANAAGGEDNITVVLVQVK